GLSNNMSDAEIDAYTSGHNTNWEDVFFRTASYNRQDLTITTGSENTANATSINYLDQEGIFFATGLQRFGFRNKFRGKTNNDKFQYTANINVTYSKMNWDSGDGVRAVL